MSGLLILSATVGVALLIYLAVALFMAESL
jgi:K+-transporting ATPase KdpF subunit